MQSTRKKDLVRSEIVNRLLARQYGFGDKISVLELCQSIGVSRQPIMTALNALSAEGFVRVTAQVGCEVVAPSRSEIGDFFLMFGKLEGVIAQLAAERRTDDELRELEEINDRILKLDGVGPRTAKQYRELNLDFHDLLHTMAHSESLHMRQASLFAMSDFLIVQTSGFALHIKEAAVEHAAIIGALRTKNSNLARDAAEEHIRQVAQFVDVHIERTLKALMRG